MSDIAAYLAEYATDEPIPVGSLVVYHGSLEYAHDVAFRTVDPQGYGVPGSLALTRLDTESDDIELVTMWNVRPKSVTLVVLP